MKALVIAPEPFFTPRGTPFSVYYRTLMTAELGVEVDLLTYGEGEDVEIPGVRIIRIPRFKLLGNAKVGPSKLKVFLDVFLVMWAVALLARNRYHFVHAHEESVFFCRFLKPLFGFRLVYDMHSCLPRQLENFNFTKLRPLIRLFERLEESSLAQADAVITICPDLEEYALTHVEPKRHFLIENSIFEDVRLRRAQSRAAPALFSVPADRPVVIYAGTFEPYQGIDLLIDGFALLVKQRPDAFLLLVGGTPEQLAHYRTLAEQHGLKSHCHFTGRVDQATARHYTALAAVQVSPRTAGTNTPLKVYEQLASGIPLVATRIHAHTQVLSDDVCFLVDPTPAAMAAGILAALNRGANTADIVRNAQRLYREKYSRTMYREKMEKLLAVIA